jgi:mono/diheme cytochrome c family protein
MGTRKTWSLTVAAATGALLVATYGTPVAAGGGQTQAFEGGSLYRTYCASCHGTSGRGDGPVAQHLRKPPANLTQIAKLNQGVFPADKVARAIDGRDVARTHGSSDMPVWGDAFTKATTASDADAVKQRIDALVRYLEGMQEKPAGN